MKPRIFSSLVFLTKQRASQALGLQEQGLYRFSQDSGSNLERRSCAGPGTGQRAARRSACRGMASPRWLLPATQLSAEIQQPVGRGWMWKEANTSTTGAGGGGKAGTAHPAAGWRGTTVPRPPLLPAPQGQMAPQQVPASQWTLTVPPAPHVSQHQNQQETPRFSAFNLLRFGETGSPQMQAGIYILSLPPAWPSAILSSRSGGGRHWPGGEGRPFCQAQPHTRALRGGSAPDGVCAAAGSLSDAG